MDKKQEAILVCHALDTGYDANDVANLSHEKSWLIMKSLSPYLVKFLHLKFKMETPMKTKIKSNIDILMKSECDSRKALETLVSHLKHKVYQ